MNSIVINYDPFGMESQVLVTKEGSTIGKTYCKSELAALADFVVEAAHEHGIQHVYARAPQVFYDELNRLAQAAQERLFGLSDNPNENIVLERV